MMVVIAKLHILASIGMSTRGEEQRYFLSTVNLTDSSNYLYAKGMRKVIVLWYAMCRYLSICSMQFRNLRNPGIAQHIFRILLMHSNLEIA